MTEAYVVLDRDRETRAIFLSLAMAMNTVERKIISEMAKGAYGYGAYVAERPPEFTWRIVNESLRECGYIRAKAGIFQDAPLTWRDCEWAILTVPYDPEEL